MNKRGWSREPWTFGGKTETGNFGVLFMVRDEGQCPLAVFLATAQRSEKRAKESAKRAISCVNALAGVPKPEEIQALVKYCVEVVFGGEPLVDAELRDILRACGVKP